MTYAPEWIIEVYNTTASEWRFIFEAVCDEVVINSGAKPSTAKIRLNGLRWDDDGGLSRLDRIRIRTPDDYDSTLLFDGVLTAWMPNFTGADENSVWFAQDLRYLFAKQNAMGGQWVFPQSSYTRAASLWASGPPPVSDKTSILFAHGRRCVFNPDDPNSDDPDITIANRSPDDYQNIIELEDGTTEVLSELPIFGHLNAVKWTAEAMILYVLWNVVDSCVALGYGPTADPTPGVGTLFAAGLDHTDFDGVVPNVVIESLNAAEALEYIAGRVGQKYRLDSYIDADGVVQYRHVFYKANEASANIRNDSNATVLHTLYATLPGDNVGAVLDGGEIMVSAGNLLFDGSNVVNRSVFLGETKMYEITVELVPAWKDGDFDTWAITDEQKAFYKGDELEDMPKAGNDPNDKNFFNYYHTSGNDFDSHLDVGRKWALNEVGTYSHSDYGRGQPFDFGFGSLGSAGIEEVIFGKNIAYFPRKVLDSLTSDDNGNVVKYFLEYSMDGGYNWHKLHDYKHELLNTEWGIRITEPNLSDINLEEITETGTNNVYDTEGLRTDGLEINYFTAILRDNEKHATYKVSGTTQWQTRVRLTASVQLDLRMLNTLTSTGSGMPELQIAVFDEVRRYKFRSQARSSIFENNDNYSAETADDRTEMEAQQAKIDAVNKLGGLSGSFEFAVIHLGVGNGIWWRPRFMLGDCVDYLAGRGVSMAVGNGKHASIEQIIYNPEQARMGIITADLRTSRIG